MKDQISFPERKNPTGFSIKVVQTNAPIPVQIVYLFLSSCTVTNSQLQEQKLALWTGWAGSGATGSATALVPGRIHGLQVFPSHIATQWIPPHHHLFANSVYVLLELGCMFLRAEVSLIYLWSTSCLALTKVGERMHNKSCSEVIWKVSVEAQEVHPCVSMRLRWVIPRFAEQGKIINKDIRLLQLTD